MLRGGVMDYKYKVGEKVRSRFFQELGTVTAGSATIRENSFPLEWRAEAYYEIAYGGGAGSYWESDLEPAVAQTSHCSCGLADLMAYGCRCGMIDKERAAQG